MFFNKTPKTNNFAEVDITNARNIYADLILVGEANESLLLKEKNYKSKWIKKVKQEAKRIAEEAISKIQGTYIISEATYDEQGNELTPAVYFEYTTKADLIDSLSSDLLDIIEIGKDIIKYYPFYDENRTYNEFVNYYQNI